MLEKSTSTADDQTRRVDPFLMSVLKSRFEAIVREMTLVVMKASRSAVIKNAKDLSCAILTYDHRLVTTEEALPIHVMSMDKATRPITELFSDIKSGRHISQQLSVHRRDAPCRHDFIDAGILPRHTDVLGCGVVASRRYRSASSFDVPALCANHL